MSVITINYRTFSEVWQSNVDKILGWTRDKDIIIIIMYILISYQLLPICLIGSSYVIQFPPIFLLSLTLVPFLQKTKSSTKTFQFSHSKETNPFPRKKNKQDTYPIKRNHLGNLDMPPHALSLCWLVHLTRGNHMLIQTFLKYPFTFLFSPSLSYVFHNCFEL